MTKFCAIIPDRGDRPQFLRHCLKQLSRQTVKPESVYVIGPETLKPVPGMFDLSGRLRIGAEQAMHDGFDYAYIIENDDYYPCDYFENHPFNGYDIIGFEETIYYNLFLSRYEELYHNRRSSLFVTGIRLSVLKGFNWPPDKDNYPCSDTVFLDRHLWLSTLMLNWSRNLRRYQRNGCGDVINCPIGIKHGVGLCGGKGHKKEVNFRYHDWNYAWLKNHVDRKSYRFYKRLIRVL